MKNIFKKIVLVSLILLPMVSMADPGTEGGDEPEYLNPEYTQNSAANVNCASATMDNLSGILTWAGCVLSNQILPILITLGVAGFILGIVKYYLNPNSKEEKDKAKNFMVRGLIALFVMVSFWGIIKIFTNTVNLNNSAPSMPSVPKFVE